MHITYQTLSVQNLSLLHLWLQESHVKEFWDDGDRTIEQVRAHYFINDATQRYLFAIDGESIGYIQSYIISADSSYAKFCSENATVMGIDFFIGNRNFMGKGLALKIFAQFIKSHCLTATKILVDPENINHRSIHLYKKYGFTKVGDHIINNKEYQLMAINVRRTVRAILINPLQQVLLMHIQGGATQEEATSFWATLGGKKEQGESDEVALARELYEETGLRDFKAHFIAYGEQTLQWHNFPCRLLENFYIIMANSDAYTTQNLTPEEKLLIKGYRWWSLTDLNKTTETIYPHCLTDTIIDYLDSSQKWNIREIDLS